MRNLIVFIWKHNFFFLFLIIETFCIYLVVQNNFYQKASFVNSSNAASTSVLQTSAAIEEYFYLKTENENLAKENAWLKTQLIASKFVIMTDTHQVNKPKLHQKYVYTEAKVVNNSTSRRNNYLTLNKGSNQGVKKNMAIISSTGVVGQVQEVSDNFCTVMSLLHSKTTVSAKIKKDGSYGPLVWNGESYDYATLNDIPTHVKLIKGDTIVTSPYSLTFPENVLIGTVESFERESGKYFYTVKVKLSTDFKKLTHVYVVTNMFKEEQETLEKKTEESNKE
ncbi:MAG: rod shape-determining protein MreC [Bacteroidetes bacterium]|nr:rod shape-determining protein MreC [Bacteroidota bacterium]